METQLAIGEIDAVVRTDDAALLAEAAAPWSSYRPRGGRPRVDYTFVADPGFAGPPTAAAEPGFDARTVAPGTVEYMRRTCRGTVIATDDRVVARFVGRPAPGVLEAGLRVAFAEILPRLGGLLVHGSSVAFADRGLVCLGPSGAGKSTLARLVSQAPAPPRALGDELTVIHRRAGGFRVYATPFSGELGPAPAAEAALAAVVFLEKAAAHRALRLSPAAAVRRLLRNVVAYVTDADAAARVLAVAAELVASVPAYTLEFARDAGVAAVLAGL